MTDDNGPLFKAIQDRQGAVCLLKCVGLPRRCDAIAPRVEALESRALLSTLEIRASWDVPTDIDLHVSEPGYEVDFRTRGPSPTGAVYTYDDTRETGPERVIWKKVPSNNWNGRGISFWATNYAGQQSAHVKFSILVDGKVTRTFTDRLAAQRFAETSHRHYDSLKSSTSKTTKTSFAVPADTWGQVNPDYCSKDGNLNRLLCWSPVSRGGSCYAIAALELRWFKLRRSFPVLPKLRSVYNAMPGWIGKYTSGIAQNLSLLQQMVVGVINDLETGKVRPKVLCAAIMAALGSGKPCMVLQSGRSDGTTHRHAAVAYGMTETASEVKFLIADSNYPDQPQILTFAKASQTWSYYWNWSDFKVGMVL